MRARREWPALAFVAVVLATAPVRGEESAGPSGGADPFASLSLTSRREPIQIKSDSLELDYKGSTLTYRGSVEVVQGDVTLTSDQLAITYDREAAGEGVAPVDAAARDAADRIREIVAEGRVRIRQRDRVAEGRRAVFDQAKQTIVLSDGAVLHEGPNQVAGDRIIVYLREQRSVVESGATSRVQAVLYPGARDEPAAGAPPLAPPAPDPVADAEATR